MKKVATFEEFINEGLYLSGIYESNMGNLIVLAQEADDYEDFVETAKKEHPEIKKEKNLDTWLKSIYNSAVNEASEDLPGAVHMKLGPKQARAVISGDAVEEYKEEIFDAVSANDKTARMEFFPKTGKIVGVITQAKLKDIKKSLVSIDKSIDIEIKKKPTLTKLGESEELNEEIHDFVKDIQAAIGKNNTVDTVLKYLGRRLSKQEYAALIKAGVMKGKY